MESSPPTEVEFEHRRFKPGTAWPEVPGAPGGTVSVKPSDPIFRRANLSRGLFVVSGSIVIAWGTQRAGIPLSGALCFFFGALPVLWVGGWLFGALFEARRSMRRVLKDAELGSTKWQQHLEQQTVLEKVKLSLAPEGLTVTRGTRGAEGRQLG